jgi:5-methylcytosine-specific restriction endonuclease McrA
MHQRDEILKLRAEGKSYSEIRNITGASKGTISYHCGHGQKEKNKIRSDKSKNRHPYTQKYYNFIDVESRKYQQIKTEFSYKKFTSKCGFTLKDIIKKFGENPKCYLTGRSINIYETETYHFDHIIPVSRGGSHKLENLGICCSFANIAKSDLCTEEFLALCKEILEYAGYNITK